MSKQQGSGMPWSQLLPARLYSAYAPLAPLSQYQFGLYHQAGATALHHYADHPSLFPHHLHHLQYPSVAAAALAQQPPSPPDPSFRMRSSVTPT